MLACEAKTTQVTCSRSPDLPASATALSSSPLLSVWSLLPVRPLVFLFPWQGIEARHCCRLGRSVLPSYASFWLSSRSPPLLASTYVRGNHWSPHRPLVMNKPRAAITPPTLSNCAALACGIAPYVYRSTRRSGGRHQPSQATATRASSCRSYFLPPSFRSS